MRNRIRVIRIRITPWETGLRMNRNRGRPTAKDGPHWELDADQPWLRMALNRNGPWGARSHGCGRPALAVGGQMRKSRILGLPPTAVVGPPALYLMGRYRKIHVARFVLYGAPWKTVA